MLTELVVQSLGVIERADLELDRGCSALTGETGAGKTLIVAALGLLLGGRADRMVVRSGASRATVEGRFAVASSHPAALLVGELDDASGGAERGEEIVLGRTVGADGRTSARINGRLVTAGTLATVGACLVEIAGQHEHLSLGSPARQREMLDAFAGGEAQAVAGRLASAMREAGRAGRESDRLGAEEAGAARELEALEVEIEELEAAGMRPGEEEDLSLEAARLEHAERIADGVAAALDDLRREGGAHELLERAGRAVGDLVAADRTLAPLADRVRSAALEADDVAAELAGRIVPPDPDALEALRERLGLIARLRRRYGVGNDVEEHLDRARRRAAALRGVAGGAEGWRRRRDDLIDEARELGGRLRELRREAAPRLARALEGVLHELWLPEARVEVRLEERDLYEGGIDGVDLVLAATPVEAPRRLGKVASGGELARVALALHLVTASEGPGTTVYDEVDAGVGGEAAHAIGRCLAELARTAGGQVLVVTHLPQVAAFADAHYRVTKSTVQGRASAQVTRVEDDERVAELSRMLAGLPSSERARGHAQELLELAAARGAR
jgi:DNA repair protein RecN (Recombination protein N)